MSQEDCDKHEGEDATNGCAKCEEENRQALIMSVIGGVGNLLETNERILLLKPVLEKLPSESLREVFLSFAGVEKISRRATPEDTLNETIETYFKLIAELLPELLPEGKTEHQHGVSRAAGVVRANLNNALHEWHGLTGRPHRLEMVPDPEPFDRLAEAVKAQEAAQELGPRLPPVVPLPAADKAFGNWKLQPPDALQPGYNAVVHPKHYNAGKFEVWDVIADWQLDFLLGNVVKYVARAGHKGNELEDLKKAQQYLNKKIAEVETSIKPKWSAELCHTSQRDHEESGLPLVWIVREKDAPERRVYCDWADDEHSGPRIDEAKAISFAQKMAPDKKVLKIYGRPT